MAWQHPRRLTLSIPAVQKFEQDLSITFEVEEAGSASFLLLLENYLEFCIKNGAYVKISNDVINSESQQPYLIILQLIGSRHICANELQMIIPKLMQYSKRVA